jgi:hypothetical protein
MLSLVEQYECKLARTQANGARRRVVNNPTLQLIRSNNCEIPGALAIAHQRIPRLNFPWKVDMDPLRQEFK